MNDMSEPRRVCSTRCLAVIDNIWAIVVCLSALCLYWRGSFSLLDYYLLPEHVPNNYWLGMAIGSFMLVTYWLLESFDACLRHASRVKYVVVTRLLLYYQAGLYMFYWWGLWRLYDYYIGTSPVELVGCMVVSVGSLLLLGCVRSIMFPPYYINLDCRPNLFQPCNRFGTTSRRDGFKFVADTFFSCLVVQGLCILYWRTAFDIMDITIYPNDPLRSDVFCYIFGAAGTALLFSLQIPLGAVSERLERNERNALKLLWEDAIYLIVLVFIAIIWRGVWNLDIRYLITDDRIGGWVNHVAGTFALWITQTFSYVAVWGCTIDGSNPGGGALFPLRYFRDLPAFLQYNDLEEESTLSGESTTRRPNSGNMNPRQNNATKTNGVHHSDQKDVPNNTSINDDEQYGGSAINDDVMKSADVMKEPHPSGRQNSQTTYGIGAPVDTCALKHRTLPSKLGENEVATGCSVKKNNNDFLELKNLDNNHNTTKSRHGETTLCGGSPVAWDYGTFNEQK